MQIERKTVDPSSIPDQVIVHYSIPAFDENMYPAFCCASEIQSSKFKIDSEVVLLSKLNPKFKRIWDPPVIGEYSLCSTEFIVCKAKQPRDKPFIFEVLNSDSVQRYMIVRLALLEVVHDLLQNCCRTSLLPFRPNR